VLACQSKTRSPIPPDLAGKPGERRSIRIRSSQRSVDHWICHRAAGKVGSADLSILIEVLGIPLSDSRRPSQLNSGPKVDRGRSYPSIMVFSAYFLLSSISLLHQHAHADVHFTSRCPFSESMNKSSSVERHKLLHLSLSSKLTTMSEAMSVPSSQKLEFNYDGPWP
jgi:hypothetical protein